MYEKDRGLSFESFKNVNQPDFFSEVEYIYAIFKIKTLPLDLLLKTVNLVCPNFLIIEGHIFLSNEFDENKFKDLREKYEIGKVQFWMNLIEITNFHEEITEEQALLLAGKIVDSWNAKIEYEDMKTSGKARVFKDPEYGEVFVTIDCKEK
ncbi:MULTISPECIES: hypothetical protein [Acinetobacter]|uniref:hypothetical protein n=1 Tax=Acinetobacter TaxID=469 RepID=UPI0002E1CC9A|nr:hypothetical protein [Acinetobacter calcoaceticus]KJH65006.1 hypothetical protein UF12_01895 [Acinetobacter calcoaceticus]